MPYKYPKHNENAKLWNYTLHPQYYSKFGYKQWETDEIQEFEF